MSTRPDGMKPEMTKNEAESHAPTALPQEMASAANLMAHPMAGVAAMGALGFGLASHAVGLWMGSVAALAEAARRAAGDTPRGDAAPASRTAPKLRVVASSDIPDRSTAAVHTLIADAGMVMRDTVEVVAEALDDIVDGALATEPAKAAKPRGKRRPVKPEIPSTPVVEAAVRVGMARHAAMRKPAAPDDLKAVSGVGPKLEKVLNRLGIWTYAQVAALDEAEIAWLDDHLGLAGRVGRDDWVGQARRLSGRA